MCTDRQEEGTRQGKGDGGDGINKLVRGDRSEEDTIDGPEAQYRA